MLVWLLMAGEIYTTYTLLGLCGWTYSRGAPVLYIFGVQPLAYVFSFFILPQVWEVGQKYRFQTQADVFQTRYGNTYLTAFVALVGVISLLPYAQVQLTGLGIIVEVSSFGEIHRTPAMVVAFSLVAGFVFVSGVRGVAWVSVIKDLLLLFTAVFVGIAVPYVYFGGVRPMFAAVARAKPSHLVMPGATTNLGHSWYISTVLLVSLSFYMWPQNFAASFTARSGNTLRRNAVLMPLYSLTQPLIFFVGLTAVLVLPGIRNGDLVFLTMVRKTFPAWFLGVVGGAGALTAMVPAAIQLLSAATLFSKNLFRPIVARGMTDAEVAQLAKVMVVVLTIGALILAIHTSASLVSLLLVGYAGVAQLLPGVVFGLYWRRVTTTGVFIGMVSGVAVTVLLMLTGRDPYLGVNAGLIALVCNFVVAGLISLFTTARVSTFDETIPALAAVSANDHTSAT